MLKTQREIFGENLQSLMNAKGVYPRIIAEEIGVSDAAVSQWLAGEKYPRIDKIQKLADYFKVPKSALIEERPGNLVPVNPATVKIPILGFISCGHPIYAEENFVGYKTESPDLLPSGNLFYLEAKGQSMEPTVPNGAYVLIREQPDVEYGEIAAVLVNGDTEATLKRVKKQGNVIMLMPDNPNYEPYIVTPDNPARILGKAIRFTQNL
ncbi:LexA family protein [Ectobacillus ponti]|uniref:XRE family transcriptional regulator n=1 Tax=Ectobacillus ponti TaxID=2961894 RepID=A0AA41XB37_9BACI|nr:XRE family transcriptional regulator [Ectobacillus ponti]MCP8969690.1 XRE family transcriptional regulator [Ectobacillus ponti]